MKLTLKESKDRTILSEGLSYHIDNKISLNESTYRMGSGAWCDLVNEVRDLTNCGLLVLNENEQFIIESNAGEYGEYHGEDVPLDAPFVFSEMDHGLKKYGVFVLDENGVTQRVLFTESENYMFIQNLKKLIKQAHEILGMPIDQIMRKLDGHKWAEDHISTSTDDVEEVHSFLMNNPQVESFIQEVVESLDKQNKSESLDRWFKEKWVDVSKKNKDGSHPPCGREDADKGAYPKCRPSKKVNKKTPKTASSYSKKDKKSMTNQKRRAEKKGRKSGKPNYTSYDKDK